MLTIEQGKGMKINSDMGESFGIWTLGNDAEVMPYLDMANIACGQHASDPYIMTRTVALARQHGVTVGAHPGYCDLQGFGRRKMELPLEQLQALFLYQLGALAAICQSQGVRLGYVKPHGALYNTMMQDDSVIRALMQSLAAYDNSLPLVLMAVPDFQRYQTMADEYGLSLLFEAFVDRAYDESARLLPRSVPDSCYHQWQDIQNQADQLVDKGSITTLSGQVVAIHADTLCIHGDGSLAQQTAAYVRGKLDRL